MRAIVYRESKSPVGNCGREWLGVRGRWVTDPAHARVFTNAGHAKNAIRWESGYMWNRHAAPTHLAYFVQPVKIEAVATDVAEEYVPS